MGVARAKAIGHRSIVIEIRHPPVEYDSGLKAITFDPRRKMARRWPVQQQRAVVALVGIGGCSSSEWTLAR